MVRAERSEQKLAAVVRIYESAPIEMSGDAAIALLNAMGEVAK